MYLFIYIYSENHAMLLRLTKTKSRRVQLMPKCLPFKSIDSLIEFDNISDDIYDEVVSISIHNFNFIYAKNINCFLIEKTISLLYYNMIL